MLPRPRPREHMDELHKLSAILIERETIDKDQFERLLAGEAEESVFPEEAPCRRRSRPRARKSASRRRSRAASRPGRSMQPPEPDPAVAQDEFRSRGLPSREYP